MSKKKWLLLLIIAFPSVFWLLLETGTVNSRKLPVYGPRQLSAGGDTLYHRTPDRFFGRGGSAAEFDVDEFPLYALSFLDDRYASEGYRVAGFWEFLNYKKSSLSQIPFIFVTRGTDSSGAIRDLGKFTAFPNVHFVGWPAAGYDSLKRVFFAAKPVYIDSSFFLLIDQERRVRGYYDARFVAEVKRLKEEYQHLRLKEEKARLKQQHEIKVRD